jgi:hypothetical protein
VAWSHSQVVEWILGSRIQSHWPCRMLWPISMLSRILATDRPAVPTSQAGGKIENSSTARLPSSRLRWVLITLRMYAASLAPRVSITLWRIASSSTPSISMSSGVRCAIGLSCFFWIVVIGSPSGDGGSGQWSRWQSPAAAWMQVWTLMAGPSPGMAVVMAPVRRSRTLPSLSGSTQP